jgi:hypothetical protein
MNNVSREKVSRKTSSKDETILSASSNVIRRFGSIEEGTKHPKALIGNHTLTYKRENPVKICYVKELYKIIDSLPEMNKPNDE